LTKVVEKLKQHCHTSLTA